jgi:spore germination protein GerM
LAQIVLTLTNLPGIVNVLFTIDGDPLRVFQRNDELTEPGEPVTREDYEELLADDARSA